ncbi:unnamed protein product [Agarophyton chilense]
MAKHERNRAIRIYHGFVSILLLLGGGALLGLGIWLEVSENSTPLGLDYNQDSYFDVVVHTGLASMIAGGFLLLAALASIISLSRKCIGVTFRVIYIIMAIVIAIVLVGTCVISALVVDRKDDEGTKNILQAAWEATVNRDKDVVCRIEDRLECRGFFDNQCINCITGLEDNCVEEVACASCSTEATGLPGCYNKISRLVNRIFLPVAIVAAVLALLLIVDFLLTCCL